MSEKAQNKVDRSGIGGSESGKPDHDAGTPEENDSQAKSVGDQDSRAGQSDADGDSQSAGSAPKEETDDAAQLKERLLRALAETENVRNRAQRELQDAQRYAISKFARDMLNVADNLQRALESVDKNAELGDNAKALLDGVEMTKRNLMQVFESYGISIIDPEGEKFDPNKHQAMFEINDTEAPEGTVVQVMQPGYAIHERLLRPALVGVAKPAPKDDKDG